MPEIDERLHHLVSTATPVTLNEVIDRSKRSSWPTERRNRRGPQVVFALTAAAAISAAAVVATQVIHHPGTAKVAIVRPLGPSVSTTTPLSVPATVGESSPPLPGCSRVDTIQWRCPITPAVAEAVTGTLVPDPIVPAGYASAYQPILYVAPGPMTAAAYQRGWTPGGAFSPEGATGPFIELRVHAHQPSGWGIMGDQEVTLNNGARATGTLSTSPAASAGTTVPPPNENHVRLTWTHAGLDYELETVGVSARQTLDVANSLP